MCYNMHVRACNVGANLLNVVSRTFPHFSQSMLTPIDYNESQFGGGKQFRTQFEHSSSYVFLCAGRVLLPAISTARRRGAVFVQRPENR